jgi:hypothetical protein
MYIDNLYPYLKALKGNKVVLVSRVKEVLMEPLEMMVFKGKWVLLDKEAIVVKLVQMA